MTRAVARAAAGAAVLALALTGCSSGDGGIADAANDKDNGYVGVDSSSAYYDPGKRGDAVEFTTETSDGQKVSTADYAGKVVVLNFWYATCPPCRTEAPTLEKVYEEYASKGVVFLGVNVRDDAATTASFEKKFGVTYPSVLDADTGDVQYALAGTVPANATPSTVVLDTKGRVAARMLGQLESDAQLSGYIDAELGN